MKKSSRVTHARRPIEYVLLITAGVLVVAAMAIAVISRRQDASNEQADSSASTVQDVDKLTDSEVTAEENTDKKADEAEAQADQPDGAAADNIGGAYDESAY